MYFFYIYGLIKWIWIWICIKMEWIWICICKAETNEAWYINWLIDYSLMQYNKIIACVRACFKLIGSKTNFDILTTPTCSVRPYWWIIKHYHSILPWPLPLPCSHRRHHQPAARSAEDATPMVTSPARSAEDATLTVTSRARSAGGTPHRWWWLQQGWPRTPHRRWQLQQGRPRTPNRRWHLQQGRPRMSHRRWHLQQGCSRSLHSQVINLPKSSVEPKVVCFRCIS